MRILTSIPDESQAHRFGDYLTAMGIGNQVEQGRDGWMIWVEHDDDQDRAKAEWNDFSRNPSDPKYTAATNIARKHRAREEKEAQKRRKNYVDVRTSWAIRSWTTPTVTLALIICCLVVAGLTALGNWPNSPTMKYLMFESPQQYAMSEQVRQVVRRFPLAASQTIDPWLKPLAEIRHGQIWRLITPIFIHFGPIHLIFNLFWLRDLGTAIERRKGRLILLALVLIGGILGNLGQYFMSGPFFGGMSGVVYALFGYIWMKGLFEPWDGLGASSQTVLIMLGWLVLCILNIIPGLNVANTAHVVGLIVGIILGASKGWWEKTRRRMRFNA